jgi:hypothetical protein
METSVPGKLLLSRQNKLTRFIGIDVIFAHAHVPAGRTDVFSDILTAFDYDSSN